MDNSQSNLDSIIQDKFKTGAPLTDMEIEAYSVTEDDEKLLSAFKRVIDGERVPGFSLQDFLATPQAKVLIPRILIGAARKAADPIYLASKFFKTVRLKSGQAIQFPSFGVMRAYDVAEGAEIKSEVSIA